ncbi:peptidoglycan-binding protein [Pseudoruegeria sp. SHC-113]|uniref:peptidoglycan-binding protein n=1 Tax=Pseudoruegeria sp. SHC-113 TaxID=2855439 RepID=UPI0021BA7E0E|nr:peptidoglycan-binding protein [Pseudoruegeria sp. SHC-113]MCT8159876.1 peptidoglycan-binding protein [Pseudoruegeria sp. SHC-113]
MTVSTAIARLAGSAQLAAIAAEAWEDNADVLSDLGANSQARIAAVLGQCAHESGRFVFRRENLNYSAEGLRRIFRKHFPTDAIRRDFARQPERIANRAYANRMGNGPESSGDGWRFRGRGYLQLTGRDNYRIFGAAIGEDLTGQPELAEEPGTAWRIAVHYMASRRRSQKSLMEWADLGDTRMVTLGINGGTHGLDERELLTAKALQALSGQASTAEIQGLLLEAGFNPGPVDGLMGPKTRAALQMAEAAFGLTGEALVDHMRGLA